MFRKMLILMGMLVLRVSLSQAQPPDTLWTQTIGGTGNDEGYSVQQTTDGGYIIAGRTMSYGAGGSDVYLIKADASGGPVWTQTFGGGSSDYGQSVQLTSDRGYIIAGYTASFGAGSSDVYLIKTNANGDSLWTKTFGGSSSDKGFSVQQTSDGGYIVAGRTISYGAGDYDVYLIKTDGSGNEQWSQTIGGTGYDEGYCVQQTTDDGYIIAGNTGSYGAGGSDFYLVKTDEYGNELWSQTFGGSSTDYSYSVQQTTDGGYIIAGYTDSYGAGEADVYLIKTDDSGNEQWSQTLGGSNWDEGIHAQQTADGGYIVTGFTYSFGAGGSDVWLIKTDASGDTLWTATYGGTGVEDSQSVQQTTDGGYVIAGKTSSFGAGGPDVWLIRLEAETVMLTLTPQNPPIQIPAGGGSFNFDLEIVNGTATNYTIDVLTDVTLPGGTTYPLLSRDGISLAPGTSLTRSLTQFVPGGAPAGNYTYNGYVYDHNTWELLAQDSFPFEKLAGDEAQSQNLGWALFGWEEKGTLQVSPVEYALHQAYPNPFNPTTTIRFDTPKASPVELAVCEINGRIVETIVNGWRGAGTHEVTFDGSDLASGIYIYRVKAGEFTASGKMLLLK